eukprot:6520062-Prymnesium_polylepis.1
MPRTSVGEHCPRHRQVQAAEGSAVRGEQTVRCGGGGGGEQQAARLQPAESGEHGVGVCDGGGACGGA